MAANVRPIPEGYHSITPYLIVKDCAKAIEFYRKSFGAEARFRMDTPDGRIGHAELKIGDSVLMLADEFPEMKSLSPQSIGGSPVSIFLYVDDVDTVFNRAVSSGSRILSPVKDQFWGDRHGRVEDPYGHVWEISTHKKDLSADELKKAADAEFKEMSKKVKE
jgi:PhnB protein